MKPCGVGWVGGKRENSLEFAIILNFGRKKEGKAFSEVDSYRGVGKGGGKKKVQGKKKTRR